MLYGFRPRRPRARPRGRAAARGAGGAVGLWRAAGCRRLGIRRKRSNTTMATAATLCHLHMHPWLCLSIWPNLVLVLATLAARSPLSNLLQPHLLTPINHAAQVVHVSETVAPGTPPLGQPPGLTVSPRVGTVHAGVSRPRVGREAPGWGGPSWCEPPRGGA